MSFLELAKRIIFKVKISLSRELPKIDDASGPFRYEYIAISHVLGVKLPEGSQDPIQVAHFTDTNAKAYLTHHWDQQYFHIDRAKSIILSQFKGLINLKRFKKLSRYLNQSLQWVFGAEQIFMRNLLVQESLVKILRDNDRPGPGCCLVYRAKGQIHQPVDLRASRRYKEFGVALDVIDRSVVREIHGPKVRNVATAVSIAMTDSDGSPEVRLLNEGVHLLGKDGLVIYIQSLVANPVKAFITTTSSNDFVAAIKIYTNRLNLDNKLSSAASLFALSLHISNDNLRSFITSWSALELLIFSLEKKYRDSFHALLKSKTVTLPAWDIDMKITEIKDYRLRDRFYAVACSLNLSDAVTDTKEFNRLNSMRNDYYHEQKIKDTELPTLDIQAIFRKYLKFELS